MSNTKILVKNWVRIYASDYTSIAAIAIKKHNTKPLASLVLSTAISVFGPLGLMRKNGTSSIYFKFNGALKNILVESDYKGNIRALIGNPHVKTDFDNDNINKIPIKVGIGEVGTLKIVNETNGSTFGGEVKMANGDITSDLAYYFYQSEQTYTAIISDIKMKNKEEIKRAYSIIFQLMPGHSEEDVIWIENFIKNNKLSTMSFNDYIEKMDAHLLETKYTRWKCKCSIKKMNSLLNSIPSHEQKSIIKEYGKLEITCNYCNKIYSKTE